MSAPRFVLLKHVPDLTRFEPKNFGVVVWAPRAAAARFVAEVDLTGDVDGRSVPSFITNVSAYKQWVRFWREQIAAGAIESLRGGPTVTVSSPEFMDALIETSTLDYIVSDGGYILDPVTPDNIDNVVDELYDRLVAIGGPPASSVQQDEPKDPDLDDICDELIREAKLLNDPNFRSGFVVNCAITLSGNIFESFEFSHAYKNGSIRQLYQRVPLSKQKKTLRKTIHDSTWMFEKVARGGVATTDQCACLVYVNNERGRDPDVVHSLEVLSSVSRVVNVGDRDAALSEFQRLSGLVH